VSSKARWRLLAGRFAWEATLAAAGVVDIKAFVPAKDFELAKQFYIDLGFTMLWAADAVSEFEAGAFRFLLQKFYVKEHAENFMMQLMVEDADAWWQHIEDVGLAAKYPGTKASPPAMQPWGLRVLYLIDPSGVLWHTAERTGKGQSEMQSSGK
jgi:uncharacterized glyoxalase superfamily protein PhnB